jgi:hypothetical protein
MSRVSTEPEPANRFFLSLAIVLDTNSNIFDLSGKAPFTVYIDVSRLHEHARRNPVPHNRPVDIIANGSLLDVSSALSQGLLSLVEIRG